MPLVLAQVFASFTLSPKFFSGSSLQGDRLSGSQAKIGVAK